MSSIEGKRSAILEVATPELGGLQFREMSPPRWVLMVQYTRDDSMISIVF